MAVYEDIVPVVHTLVAHVVRSSASGYPGKFRRCFHSLAERRTASYGLFVVSPLFISGRRPFHASVWFGIGRRLIAQTFSKDKKHEASLIAPTQRRRVNGSFQKRKS